MSLKKSVNKRGERRGKNVRNNGRLASPLKEACSLLHPLSSRQACEPRPVPYIAHAPADNTTGAGLPSGKSICSAVVKVIFKKVFYLFSQFKGLPKNVWHIINKDDLKPDSKLNNKTLFFPISNTIIQLLFFFSPSDFTQM